MSEVLWFWQEISGNFLSFALKAFCYLPEYKMRVFHESSSEKVWLVIPTMHGTSLCYTMFLLAWSLARHPVRITPCSRVGVCYLIFCKFQLGHMVKSQTLHKGGQFWVLFKPLVFMHNYHVTTEGFRKLPPTPNLVWLLYFPAKVKLCNKWNSLYFLKDYAVTSVIWVCSLTVTCS